MSNNIDESETLLDKRDGSVYYIVAGKKRKKVDRQQWLDCSELFYKITAGRSILPMSLDGYLSADALRLN